MPTAPFCVRCGEPLENSASPYPHEARGYAVAPEERWFSPHVISTLFPHLPRAHMVAFRAALVLGAAAIVALGATRLFALALVVAAILVPFITVVYLWDVDLYEDEPLPMVAATAAWGTAVGIALGLAARHLTSPPRLLQSGPPLHDVVWLGVALPAIGATLGLAGPLLLLPYRRFNDVLDGATFGGTSAVFMLGAEVVTNSAAFIGGGLTAPGDAVLWVPRLLMLGIAVPVAGACFVGAAGGAFWLRFRSAPRDRRRLGVTGTPLVATALAVAALVAVELVVFYIGPWSELAVATAVGVVGIVLLRRTLHLGLLQEAAEIEIRPAVRCPNCGRGTPLHTFCSHCGVALQAVPKAGIRAGAGTSLGDARMARRTAAVVAGGLVAAATCIALLVIVLIRPASARPACAPREPCAGPPARVATVPSALSARRSSGLVAWFTPVGPGLYYDRRDWDVDDSESDYLQLSTELAGNIAVYAALQVWSSSTMTQATAFQATHDAIAKHSLGMTVDKAPEHAVLGAELQYVPAAAGVYSVTLNLPPSPGQAYHLVLESAANGPAAVSTVAYTNEREQLAENHAFAPFDVLGNVDGLLDQFSWRR